MILVKALLMIAVSHFAAYFILSRLTDFKEELKLYFKAAFLVISVIIVMKPPVVSFIIIFFLVRFLSQKLKPEQVIAFYFSIMFSFTLTQGYTLSVGVVLGGVNYLTVINWALLLPLLFKKTKKLRLTGIDKLVIAFFAFQFILNLRDDSFTNGLRKDFWLTMHYIVPYLAIRKFVGNYSLIYVAIGFALLSQMFVAVIEGLMSWKLYTTIETIGGYPRAYNPYYFRNGFLRVNAVFSNPLIISLFANFGVLYSYIWLMRKDDNAIKGFSRWLALGAVVTAIMATFFTGSRAGLMGILATLIAYHGYLWAAKVKKDPIPKMALAAVIVVAIFIVNNQKFIEEEFGYRYQLFVVSKDVILDNFLFGDLNGRRDPRMEVLIQGEGIVDLVNSYIYFSLFYGVPAMLCFAVALGSGIFRSYKLLRREEDKDKHTLALFCCCSLTVLMFNIATTSPGGWIYRWVWYLLPICASLVAKSMEEQRKRRLELKRQQNAIV